MNHAFVTSRKRIDNDKVTATLQDLVDGLHAIELRHDPNTDGWWIGHGEYAGVAIWLKTSRKLAFRRGALGDFTSWLQNLAQCTLGMVLDGRLSDEGVSGTWGPSDEQTPTWRSYFDHMFGHCPKAVVDDLWQRTVDSLPEDLRKLAQQEDQP